MAAENAFFVQDQPWKRAEMVVDGAPTLGHDPETQFVAFKNLGNCS